MIHVHFFAGPDLTPEGITTDLQHPFGCREIEAGPDLTPEGITTILPDAYFIGLLEPPDLT